MDNNYVNNSKLLNEQIKNSFSGMQEYIPIENSYIENILRLNKGKKVSIYQSFSNANQECFNGILEECGKDHIIISDPTSGLWYLLLMPYVEYIKFDEDINTKEQLYHITK